MTNQVDLFTQNQGFLPDKDTLKEMYQRINDFQAKAFKSPDKNFVKKTPDNRAESLVISAVETTLDEMYGGLWNATNFHWRQIGNEVVGSITLEVFHPECGIWIKRDGAGAIQIMVDKAPANVNRNQWALDMANKKPNALYMGFPKLKAECLKNAAKSLGNVFGRNLNRQFSDNDFEPETQKDETNEIRKEILDLLAKNKTLKASEIEAVKKLTENEKTSYTRLLGVLTNLKK